MVNISTDRELIRLSLSSGGASEPYSGGLMCPCTQDIAVFLVRCIGDVWQPRCRPCVNIVKTRRTAEERRASRRGRARREIHRSTVGLQFIEEIAERMEGHRQFADGATWLCTGCDHEVAELPHITMAGVCAGFGSRRVHV